MKFYYWVLSFTLILLNPNQIQSQDSEAIVDAYLLSQFQKSTLGDLEYIITNDHVSKLSNVHHYYFSQTLNEIQIVGTNSSVHISGTNKTISDSNHFLKDIANRRVSSQVPALSAYEVVLLVANQLGYKMTEELAVLNKKGDDYLFSQAGISINPIPVKLKYLVTKRNDLELVWEIIIHEINQDHLWNIRASAGTGEIIEKDDLVLNCSMEHDHGEENRILSALSESKKPLSFNMNSEDSEISCTECYEVIKYPIESPLHGERSIEVAPANLAASPFGWHDSNGVPGSEHTVTRGNNVYAFEGDDNYGYHPDGGVSLNFTGYDFDPIFSEESQYEAAALTNYFYWLNILHDLWYEYGFTEAAGNFQNVNYTGEGISGDSVYAQAQNNTGGCNASFSVSMDGLNPTMRINTCGDKDGVFDNSVIIHEYAHGLTIRLIGGSAVSGCLFNKEQMGEGWSDWYALLTTIQPGDSENLTRGIANYYRGDGALGGGVRKYPYTTDIILNPLTYDSIKTIGVPHGVGTIWAEILWEMTWGLINEYGFDPNLTNFTGNIEQDAGNVIAMAIVTEGLKITPCNPGFVDARDAILIAAHTLYGIELDCVLWPAFAKRGLGINAFQGDSGNLEDGLASYEIPPNIAAFEIFRDHMCDETQILYNETGGLPHGGIYSGPGVTDNGDGRSYTFDPSALGPGNFRISYTIVDSGCQVASSAEDTVEIISDNEPPIITCREDVTVTVPFGESEYSLPYFAPTSSDNCTSSLFHRQEPILNSPLALGRTLVTVHISDASGNESTCSFNITVLANDNNLSGDLNNGIISLFPNPTKGKVEMRSAVDIGNLVLTIYDINGRLIGELLYRKFGYTNTFSLDNYTPGLYIVKIETEEFSQMHKIFRK